MVQFPGAVSQFVPRLLLLVLPTIFGGTTALATQKPEGKSVLRWTAGGRGSAFSRTADGKYVYSLKDDDCEIAIAIDSQELEKVRHRPIPIFTIRLDAHYTGQKSVALTVDAITLAFASHFQVVNKTLDPDELTTRIQNDIDALGDETEHEVRKHPEKKQEKDSLLQAHLKDMTDLVGFISLHSLSPATLNPGNPTIGGWIFFSTKSKWIGRWKAQEQFVLRVPVEDRIFEFPFSLPPSKGDRILRRRPD